MQSERTTAPQQPRWSRRLALAWRERRSSSMRLMAAALVISVGAVSAVGILGQRVQSSLLADAGASLGGDRLLLSDQPIAKDWLEAADQNGLKAALGSQFPSVVVSEGEPTLVSVKTAGEGYPLRGSLVVETADGPVTNPRLPPGGIWLDAALAARQDLQVGDSIRLGEARFRVDGLILVEPDRGMNFVNLAPRVIIRHDALAATGLEQPGSRITYRLWLSGDRAEQLGAFDREIEPTLRAGQRLETLENARPELRNAIDRARAFLALTSMVSLLIACAALGLAARQLARVQQPRLAVLKALGASSATLRSIWLLALLVLVIVGGLLGLGLGLLIQSVLAWQLNSLLAVPLAPVWQVMGLPVLQAFGTSCLVVLLFAGPSLARALEAPAVESLRGEHERRGSGRDTNWMSGRRLLGLVGFGLGLTLLMWLGSGEPLMAALVAGGFAAMGLVLSLSLAGLMRSAGLLLSRLPLGRRVFALRTLSRSLHRRAFSLSAQVVGLSLALAALMLLSFLRTDLVEAWGRSLPQEAPNRFLLNILPGQEAGVLTALQAAGIQSPTVHPMVRGRLVAINGEEVNPDAFEEARARRLLDREMNLSYADQLPTYNRLLEGLPLAPDRPEVSVEQGMAKTLGLGLGDWLRFDVAGDQVDAQVTSIRGLRWDSMEVNFFMILSPSLIGDQAQTWISSFYVAPEAARELARSLYRQYPGLTLVELDALLLQIRRVLEQGVAAVQALFLLGLVSGALVLWAALEASRSERQREAALLRALGARRAQLVQSQVLELLLVGGLAGLIGAVLAQLLGQVVAEQVFALVAPWRWQPLGLGALIGGLTSLLAGLLALRRVIQTPAMAALRAGLDGPQQISH